MKQFYLLHSHDFELLSMLDIEGTFLHDIISNAYEYEAKSDTNYWLYCDQKEVFDHMNEIVEPWKRLCTEVKKSGWNQFKFQIYRMDPTIIIPACIGKTTLVDSSLSSRYDNVKPLVEGVDPMVPRYVLEHFDLIEPKNHQHD